MGDFGCHHVLRSHHLESTRYVHYSHRAQRSARLRNLVPRHFRLSWSLLIFLGRTQSPSKFASKSGCSTMSRCRIFSLSYLGKGGQSVSSTNWLSVGRSTASMLCHHSWVSPGRFHRFPFRIALIENGSMNACLNGTPGQIPAYPLLFETYSLIPEILFN